MANEATYSDIGKLISEAGQHHRQGQHTLALQCYRKAIALSVNLDDPLLRAFLLAEAGIEHRDNDNYYHAIDLMTEALALMLGQPSTDLDVIAQRARIKKLLAITFRDVYGPQKPEVMQLLEESRADFARIDEKSEEANVLQHLGDCYIELGHLQEADGMLQKALQKARAQNNVQIQGWILKDMADLEIAREEWGLALEFVLNAREKVCSVQDLEGEADTWVTEARIRLRTDQIDEALTAANHALDLYLQNKNLRRSINARQYVARTLTKQERLDEAISMLQKGVRTAERLDLPLYQARLYLELGETEVKRKNYGMARQYANNARKIAIDYHEQELEEEANELLLRYPDTTSQSPDRQG